MNKTPVYTLSRCSKAISRHGRIACQINPAGIFRRPDQLAKIMLRDLRLGAALRTRELASVLAALRYWQERFDGKTGDAWAVDEIASNCNTMKPLTSVEIDRLCETLNNQYQLGRSR